MRHRHFPSKRPGASWFWSRGHQTLSETSILIPAGGLAEWLTPIPFVVACQLFAYHLTRAKGFDVESPRRLQKVTRTL